MTAPHHAPLPYRGDIDGLRAIAVLAVVLYHFGLPLSGGFVGVDVFFVISGFLIGGILWREYDATGRISLVNFYIRRFRRLAPAFFTMVLVTTAAAWLLLLPYEFRNYGKSVIAATVYLSNVFFFRQSGYFDTASEDKPLLHTWSLAVEEQFYIFLPLVMVLLARWRWGLLGTLVAAWVISLAACVLITPLSHTATFYLFPFRAWELLSGVLLAIWGHETRHGWRGHPALSSVGIVMIGASLVFIPEGEMFPGVLAIPPVLGTMLLLSAGTGRNAVNRLLTHHWMRFFGLISYSLYLWHWPVYTLSYYLRRDFAGPLEIMAWLALCVLLASLSWRYVEQPVRHARTLRGRNVFAGMTLASMTALTVGGVLYVHDGLPGRFGPEVRAHMIAAGDFDWHVCKVADGSPLAGVEVCRIGPDGPPRLLVWGDSHVRGLQDGLDVAAQDAGVPGLVIWRAGCPPLFGLRKNESVMTPAEDAACPRSNRMIRTAIGDLDSIESVLLIGRWGYYASGRGTGTNADVTIALYPDDPALSDAQDQTELVTRAALQTVAELSDAFQHVFVLRQPPEIPYYNSRDAAREAAHAAYPLAAAPTVQGRVTLDEIQPRTNLADAPWLPLRDEGLITFLDPWPWFCKDGVCSAVQDGIGLFFDNNHITGRGAVQIREALNPVFDSVSIRLSRTEVPEG